jgi:hypothetical protein
MTPRTERAGSRFVLANTDDGRPLIRPVLFHDTVSSLKSLTVGFEVLSGTMPEQARTLVDVMNERIVGVAARRRPDVDESASEWTRRTGALTVHSESEYFQYFRWDIPIVFVSTHPLLQFSRASVFPG